MALNMNPALLVTARVGESGVIFCIQSLGKLDRAISWAESRETVSYEDVLQQGLLCTLEWVVRAALRWRFKSNFRTLMHPCLHLSCQIFSSWFCSRPNFISLCSHLDRVPLAGNKSVSSFPHHHQSSCGAYVSFCFRFWTSKNSTALKFQFKIFCLKFVTVGTR
jgi:hypothetical protein